MKKFRELMVELHEDAPANSVGLPSGISPPAEPNKTSTNIPTKRLNRTQKLVKRK